MTDLEQALRELRVEWPATPDLAAAVRPRLEPRPARRGRRRWVAAAIALLLGATMAVEPARSAIFEFLGLKTVRIERRAPVATPDPGADLGLGRPVAAAEAARLAGFTPAPPAALGAPDGVFFDAGRVSYLYEGRPRILVMELRATVEPVIQKSAGPGTSIERLTVDGSPAFWLGGRAHGFAYVQEDGNVDFEEQRLAGPTLLLERDGLLLRVEGRISRRRAIEIARSISATSEPATGSSE